MALLDIFKGKKKKADKKLKRPPKGVFKQSEKKKSQPSKKEKLSEEKFPKRKDSVLASRVILAPHITEKSTLSAEKGVYAFRVSSGSNKVMIKRSIEELYGFKPTKINIVNIPSKRRVSRGRAGVKPGFKKAVVYLKKGDKIVLT